MQQKYSEINGGDAFPGNGEYEGVNVLFNSNENQIQKLSSAWWHQLYSVAYRVAPFFFLFLITETYLQQQARAYTNSEAGR